MIINTDNIHEIMQGYLDAGVNEEDASALTLKRLVAGAVEEAYEQEVGFTIRSLKVEPPGYEYEPQIITEDLIRKNPGILFHPNLRDFSFGGGNESYWLSGDEPFSRYALGALEQLDFKDMLSSD